MSPLLFIAYITVVLEVPLLLAGLGYRPDCCENIL
jgi:hypothetical protein